MSLQLCEFAVWELATLTAPQAAALQACNARSLPQACNACSSVATLRFHRPSLWNSWAFCGTVTSDVTLLIFVRPRTFIRLRTSVKLSSVQGRSSDFHPLDLCPSRDDCRTFVRLRSCHPAHCRPTLCCPTSYHFIVRPFHPTFVWLRLTFVQPSLDVRLTSVQRLAITNHFQRRIVFFKPYVVLEFCS